MTHGRLHALSDGIFAIVMTLMVLELKLPSLSISSSSNLWNALYVQKAVFASYFVSFAVLFIYWRAHNFVITILAKNIDINLLTINGIFLFLVGLIPYTTQLAGTYNTTPLAISIYAANIFVIGFTLLIMRIYIERSEKIENLERTAQQRRAALIRTILPMSFAALSIPFSFINTGCADIILLIGVGYNFLNNAAEIADKYLIQPINKMLHISL